MSEDIVIIKMKYKYNDGGRKAAGFKGETGDCVTRAISIATGKDYLEVYNALNALSKEERPRKGRSRSAARTGVHKRTYRKYLESLGWKWEPLMGIGTARVQSCGYRRCQVHLKDGDFTWDLYGREVRLIVSLSKHLAVVIDGVIHDTGDPSRNGTRCVYGYFWEGEKEV